MTQPSVFDVIVQEAREELIKTGAAAALDMDLEGVRVDATTHQFPYPQSEPQGGYIQIKIDGVMVEASYYRAGETEPFHSRRYRAANPNDQ